MSCSFTFKRPGNFVGVLQILLKKLLLEKKEYLSGKNGSSAASVPRLDHV